MQKFTEGAVRQGKYFNNLSAGVISNFIGQSEILGKWLLKTV